MCECKIGGGSNGLCAFHRHQAALVKQKRLNAPNEEYEKALREYGRASIEWLMEAMELLLAQNDLRRSELYSKMPTKPVRK